MAVRPRKRGRHARRECDGRSRTAQFYSSALVIVAGSVPGLPIRSSGVPWLAARIDHQTHVQGRDVKALFAFVLPLARTRVPVQPRLQRVDLGRAEGMGLVIELNYFIERCERKWASGLSSCLMQPIMYRAEDLESSATVWRAPSRRFRSAPGARRPMFPPRLEYSPCQRRRQYIVSSERERQPS